MQYCVSSVTVQYCVSSVTVQYCVSSVTVQYCVSSVTVQCCVSSLQCAVPLSNWCKIKHIELLQYILFFHNKHVFLCVGFEHLLDPDRAH